MPDRDVPPSGTVRSVQKIPKGRLSINQERSRECQVIYLSGEDQLVFLDLNTGEPVAGR
ncbi:MAG: hypothetical protein QOI57_504 [Rubrobacteraceae bacterium]|jgi:hypothetical protein|nr:hypothetical protein [Rubrobacteraceae bacterium]